MEPQGPPLTSLDPLEETRRRALSEVLALLDRELGGEEDPDARAALIRAILLVELLLATGRVRQPDP